MAVNDPTQILQLLNGVTGPPGNFAQPVNPIEELLKQRAAAIAETGPLLPVPEQVGTSQRITAGIGDALAAAATARGRVPLRTDALGDLRRRRQRRESIIAANAATKAKTSRDSELSLIDGKIKLEQQKQARADKDAQATREEEFKTGLELLRQEGANARSSQDNETRLLIEGLRTRQRQDKEEVLSSFAQRFDSETQAEIAAFARGNPLSGNPQDRIGLAERLRSKDLDPLTVMREFGFKISSISGSTKSETATLKNKSAAAYQQQVLPIIARYLQEIGEAVGFGLRDEVIQSIMDGDVATVERVLEAVERAEQQAQAEAAEPTQLGRRLGTVTESDRQKLGGFTGIK